MYDILDEDATSLDWERDATLLMDEDLDVRPQERVTKSLTLVENTLDWYDHIACAFLLYKDPCKALEKIKSLQSGYHEKLEGWRQIVLTPLFQSNSEEKVLEKGNMVEKLAEVLHVLKHHKLLSLLELAVISPVHIDPLRLKLFKKIDNMDEEKAKLWVDQLTSLEGLSKSDPTWCLEMNCLKWIEEGHISILLKNPPITPPVTPENIPSNLFKNIETNNTGSSEVMRCEKFEITHGLCIIINQMRFYVNQDQDPEMCSKENLAYRYGSDADRDKLSETFRMLGHTVEIYENLTREEFLNTMDKIRKYDFKSYDSLVMCILSHGEKGVVFSSDSTPISLETIKSYFNGILCPELVQKPKLFIIQACQGQESQRRVSVLPVLNHIEHDAPAVSNFFEAWATVPGFLSYRSTFKGAVFVRHLCFVLQTCAHTCGLSDIMTIVNDRVSKWQGGQMPCTISSLTRGVNFKRNEERLVESIVDKLERELLDLAIMSATRLMWKNDPVTLQKTLNAWRS